MLISPELIMKGEITNPEDIKHMLQESAKGHTVTTTTHFCKTDESQEFIHEEYNAVNHLETMAHLYNLNVDSKEGLHLLLSDDRNCKADMRATTEFMQYFFKQYGATSVKIVTTLKDVVLTSQHLKDVDYALLSPRGYTLNSVGNPVKVLYGMDVELRKVELDVNMSPKELTLVLAFEYK